MTFREDNYLDAGEMRTSVEVLAVAEPDDFRGTPDPAPVWKGWAAWEPLRGSRAQTIQQQYGQVTSRVVIRYREGIRPGMFVRRCRDGAMAAIVEAVPVAAGDRWLEMLVNEVVT